jgi:hypothetical protein
VQYSLLCVPPPPLSCSNLQMPTTSTKNSIHPASSSPRMTPAQSERIQALTLTQEDKEASISTLTDPKKKKERWTGKRKKLAAEASQATAEASQASAGEDQDPPYASRPGKKRLRKLNHLKKQASLFEWMLLSAENAQFTGSVVLASSITCPLRNNQNRTVDVQTSCSLQLQLPPTNSLQLLQVQPLLVLDLNGILCHRIRSRSTAAVFRPSIACVAGTPIVPRTDLYDMLHYLDQHFCLAVWTSAKAKSAKQLVNALIPPHVVARLLFVWAQHDCDTNNTSGSGHGCDDSDDDNNLTFKKDLSKVWTEFPAWNSHNSLLMDDSPDKCVAWRDNAVHPPALNGLLRDISAGTTETQNDDEINARQQRLFLEQLVQHWKEHAVLQIWNETKGDSTVTNNADGQLQFLKRHAVGHMGWSTSTTDSTELT